MMLLHLCRYFTPLSHRVLAEPQAMGYNTEKTVKGIVCMDFIHHIESPMEMEALLSEHELVLVDFWASWCGPCRMLAPVFEDLSDDYAGKVTFAKVNVDDNRELAKQYKIMSIPQLLLFKNGKLVNSMVGAQPREDIAAMLDSTL